MPRYIVKLVDSKENKDYYMEWSTVVDAPVTYGMGLEEFKAYYKEEYGKQGMDGLEERLNRVNEKGTSSMLDNSAEDTISFNRAGEGGRCISFEEILQKFCINIPMGPEYSITNIDNITKIFVGDADFIHHVRKVAVENDDAEMSILTVGEAEDYLREYCPNLKLEKK